MIYQCMPYIDDNILRTAGLMGPRQDNDMQNNDTQKQRNAKTTNAQDNENIISKLYTISIPVKYIMYMCYTRTKHHNIK